MNRIPFFSIIIPTFNRAQFISSAINSVISQTLTNWELIIVDDGSTDNTQEVVQKYGDDRIRYIYQANAERSSARNKGIDCAKGEYICFLDSDDYFLPEKLANLKNAIDKKRGNNFVFYDGLIFELQGTRKKVPIPQLMDGESNFEFLLQNPIGPLQVCAKKKCFEVHKFNTNLRIGEDVELWLRMANELDFLRVDSYQTIALEHEDRSVNLKKYNSAKEQLKQLELIFVKYTTEQISKKVRKKLLSGCYFGSAKHYMMNRKRWKAIFLVLKAIIADLRNEQLKHRFFTLVTLFSGNVPKEYS